MLKSMFTDAVMYSPRVQVIHQVIALGLIVLFVAALRGLAMRSSGRAKAHRCAHRPCRAWPRALVTGSLICDSLPARDIVARALWGW